MTYTVAFPSAGYFPFYCSTHAHLNMVGVVQVMP
jgi:plastocyanin